MSTTTVITADALELIAQLNETVKNLLESVKILRDELPPREISPALFTPEQAGAYTGIAVTKLALFVRAFLGLRIVTANMRG